MTEVGSARDLGHPHILLHIVELHFEELEALWERREEAAYTPDWFVAELGELERRAAAHLDGLIVAGGHAVDWARPSLLGEDSYAAAAAASLFLALDHADLRQEVLAAFESEEAPPARDGIRLALRHAPLGELADGLTRLCAGGDLSLAAAAADVLAFQRLPVRDVARLTAAAEPAARRLAYGAMGRLRQLKEPGQLSAALADDDAEVRKVGLRAAAMSALPGLVATCRKIAVRREAPEREALEFVGVLGDATDRSLLESALRDPERRAAALAGLGALGSSDSIAPILECLAEEGEDARWAADAFQRITGAEDVEQDESAAPPDDSDLEGNDEADLEAEFADPAPSAEKARAWWGESAGRFAADVRWQYGLDTTDVMRVLERLPLVSRRDAYLAACAAGDVAVPDVELEALQCPWRSLLLGLR